MSIFGKRLTKRERKTSLGTGYLGSLASMFAGFRHQRWGRKVSMKMRAMLSEARGLLSTRKVRPILSQAVRGLWDGTLALQPSPVMAGLGRRWRRSHGADLRRGGRMSTGRLFDALESRQLLSNTAGNVDTTYGTAGVTRTDFGGGVDTLASVAYQHVGANAGKTVAVGYAPSLIEVARYNTDGSLDTNFGLNGVMTISSIPGYTGFVVSSVATQSNDSIIIAGSATKTGGTKDFLVLRLTPNGSVGGALDTTFAGGNGFIGIDVANKDDTANAMLVQPNDTIDVVGQGMVGGLKQFTVAQLTSAGTLDASFGTGGVFRVPSLGNNSQATGIAYDSATNKLVVVGNDGVNFAIARLVTTGANPLDTSFDGGTGAEMLNIVGTASAIAVTPGGSYLLAGAVNGPGGTDFAVVKVTGGTGPTSGVVDLSFGVSGVAKADFANGDGSMSDQASALAIQPAGSDYRIVVVGQSADGVTGQTFSTLARFTSAGALDSSFGTGGEATISVSSGAGNSDAAQSVLMTSDGRMIVAGSANTDTNSDFYMARVQANDAPVINPLDASFSLNATTEDVASTPVTVGSLLASAGETDPDVELQGIAVIGASSANGTWQYSTDNGGTWISLSGTSLNNTRLLSSDTQVRFLPTHGYFGASGNTLTFLAWDQVAGTAGTLVDTTLPDFVASNTVSTTSATASISVTEATLTITSITHPADATEQSPITNAIVAHFTESSPVTSVDDFTATITWADGTTSAGTIVANGVEYDVLGSHTYLEEINVGQTFAVSVTDVADPAAERTVSDSVLATVADAQLTNATGVNISATEGSLFTGTVATFVDPAGSESVSDYTATIDWGAAGTGSTTGTIVDEGGGHFHVVGSFTYAEEGGPTIQVTLTHDALPSVLASSSTAAVADAALSSTPSDLTPPTATEGAPITGVVVFHFTDANPNGTASDFVATVNTGDATLTSAANPANVQVVAHAGGGFDVLLTYTYAEELASQTFSVSVTDHDATTSQSISTFSVADAALNSAATDLTPPTATEGSAFSDVVVFHFTDADPNGTASDYVATVNTGDATLTSTANPGNVQVVAHSGGGFDVLLSYTYAEELTNQTFSVSVTDHSATTSQSISTFNVADAALSSMPSNLTPPTATEGAAFSNVVVFHFTDADPAGKASDYVATVYTGDATLTSTADPGNVQIVSNDGGGFDVKLSYTYAEELTNATFSVSVTDHGATTSQSISTFNVADAALASTPSNLTPPSATEAVAFSDVVVFHFTDADPNGTISDYVATVNTGDATLTSTANPGNVQIVAHSGGGFDVLLSYTYAEELTNATFSVSVTDYNATTSQNTSVFTVADQAVNAGGNNFGAVTGGAFTDVPVATFTDPAGAEDLGNYHATINWGDGPGIDSNTTIAVDAHGNFTVEGSHTYTADGMYHVTVTISHETAPDTIVTSLATVSNAVYVNDNWVDAAHPGSPVFGDTLTSPGNEPTGTSSTLTFGVNAFSSIQNGINAVSTGGTVHVLAGTYAESVVVNKANVTILGARAGQSTATRAASFDPTTESVITAPTVNPNGGQLISITASNVTIDGLVVDGSNASLGTTGAVQINGAGPFIDVRNGITTFADVNNVVIRNCIVQNVNHDGIAVLTTSDTDSPTSGNLIDGNLVRNFADYGIVLGWNAYGSVTNNTVIAPDNATAGVWIYDYTRSGATTDLQTVNIENNDVTIAQNALGGIWSNLFHPGSTATLNITDNTVNGTTNVGAGVYPVMGIYVTSSNSASVTIALNDNTVGATGGTLLSGIAIWNAPAATVSISGGSIGHSTIGIDLDEVDVNFGNATGTTTVNVSDVSISGVSTGIRVGAVPSTWANNPLDPWGDASNTVTGSVSLVLTGGSITDATNAIEVQAQSTGTYTASLALVGGTAITGGLTGIAVDGANASITGDTLNDTVLTGQSGDYISLVNGAMVGHVINATGVTFGTTPAGQNLATDDAFAIEDKITDAIDATGLGYVQLRTGHVYVTPNSFVAPATNNTDAVQRAIDVAVTGDIVHLKAGTYIGGAHADGTDGLVAGVVVNKSVTLLGPNASYDPNSNVTPGNYQAIIVPGTSDPNINSLTESVVIEVTASNVTIQGLTIDGDNPNLTSGVIYNGADIDAAEGIVSYKGVGHITVTNNIVRNTAYSGVDFYNYDNGGNATSDNIISQNYIANLSDAYGYGVGVIIYNNFYAQVNDNVISDVLVGVQTGNFYNANSDSSFAPSISGNHIAARKKGIFFNLAYSNASTFTINGNTITAISEQGSPVSRWDGILLSSLQTAVSVNVTNNSIDGAGANATLSDGYNVWNTPTTGAVTISGGDVTGVAYGIWLNSYEGYSGKAAATQATISGVDISASQVGIYIEDSAQNNTHPPVSATITDATTITGGVTGIQVDGSNASITGDTLNSIILTGQSGDYISLLNGAMAGHDIDATHVTFGTLQGSAMNAEQGFATEDMINDYLDHSSLGFVRLATGKVWVTQASESSQQGSLPRGLLSPAGVSASTVLVQGGSLTYEGSLQVTSSLALAGVTENTVGVTIHATDATTLDATLGSTDTLDVSNATFTVDTTGPTVSIIHATGGSSVSLSDVTTGDCSSGDSIAVSGTNSVSLTRCNIGSSGQDGIDLSNVSSVSMTSVSVANIGSSGQDGVSISNAASISMSYVNVGASAFTGITINGLRGIALSGTPNMSLSDITVGACATGIAIADMDGDGALDRVAVSGSSNGIVFDGGTGSLSIAEDNTHQITGFTGTGIQVGNLVGDLSITGAVLSGAALSPPNSPPVGIGIDSVSGLVSGQSCQITCSGDGLVVTNSGSTNQPVSFSDVDVDCNGTGIDLSGSNASIAGCTITAHAQGIDLDNSSTASITGSNSIDAGINGIVVQGGSNATVDGATISNSSSSGAGVQLISGTLSLKRTGISGFGTGVELDGGSATVGGSSANDGNTITDCTIGIQAGQFGVGGPSSLTISNNHISDTPVGDASPAGSGGLVLLSLGITPTISNNTIDGAEVGIYACDNSAPITISSGSISNATNPLGTAAGVFLDNGVIFGSATHDESVTLAGVHLDNDDSGIIAGDLTGATHVTVGLQNGVSISGGHHGITIQGSLASIAGATLNDTSFTGFSGADDNYIELYHGAMYGAAPAVIDATGATFNGFAVGTTAPNASSLDTFYAIEDRIVDYLDPHNSGDLSNLSVGYVRLQSGFVFATSHAEDSLAGVIQRSVNVAVGATSTNAGDRIGIQARTGSYLGGVDINKDGLTLSGVNSNASREASAPSVSEIVVAGGNALAISANHVTLNGLDIQGVSGVTCVDISGSDALVTSCVIRGASTGIRIEQGASRDSISADDISTVTGGTAIDVEGANAHITNNSRSIHGAAIGIDVNGGSAVISGDHFYNNDIAIRLTNYGTASIQNNNFGGVLPELDNLTDLQLTSTAGALSSLNGNSFAGDNFYIDNHSTQNIDISGDGGSIGTNSFDFANNYRIEDHMYHMVDDASVGLVSWVAGNIFVTSPQIANPDASASTDSSIQRGINAASAGNTVNIEAGDFTENFTINKFVTLVGAGSGSDGTTNTIIHSAAANTPVVSISASGNSASDRLTIEGLRITGATGAGNSGAGILVSSGSHLAFSNVTIVGNGGYGLASNLAGGTSTDWAIDHSTFDSNADGLRIASTDTINGLSITNSIFENNQYGIETYASSSAVSTVTNVTVSDTQFLNNLYKGAYFEKLDHASFSNITVTGNGTGNASPAGFDLNLKYASYSNISFNTATFTNNGNGAAGGFALGVKGRNDGSYSGHPATLTGVSLTNVLISGSPSDLYIDNNTSGVTLSGVKLAGTGLGLSIGNGLASQTVNIGDTAFAATLAGYIANTSTDLVDATGATFGAAIDTTTGVVTGGVAAGASLQPSDAYAIEDKILDAIDVSGYGLVRLKAGNVYVTPNSFFSPATTTPSIQRGVDAASDNDTVNVEAGMYLGTGSGASVVTIDKPLTLLGANAGIAGDGARGPESIINGNSTGEGYYVVRIQHNNVTVDGFEIENPSYSGTADASGIMILDATDGSQQVSNVTIANNRIHDIGTTTRPVASFGTYGINAGPVNHLTVDGNAIFNLGNIDANGEAVGILTWGNDPDNLASGLTLTADNLDITNNTFSAITNPAGEAYAIRLAYDSANATVSGNVITGIAHGIVTSPSMAAGTVDITDNTITNAGIAGIWLRSPFGETVSQNTISGSGIGLKVSNGGVLTSATQNFIANNTTGILIGSDSASIGGIHINSITGNLASGLENDSAYTVDASNNWWGSLNGPTTMLNTYASTGTGDKITGNAVITPWLIDDIDSAPSTPGFQHDATDATPVMLTAPSNQTATEGLSATVNLGWFADDVSSTGQWSVIVSWGDGSLNSVFPVNAAGPLSFSHTYVEESLNHVTVRVTDGSGNTDTKTFDVTVADAALTASPTTVHAVEGSLTSVTSVLVATFTDQDPAGIASDYSAAIDWGDGDTTASYSIVADLNVAGQFDVIASKSHAYAEEGSKNITVVVTDHSASDTAVSSAVIADAALNAGALTPPTATEGIAFTNVPVFHFTDDAGTYADIADYTAVVTLGDGNQVTLTSTPSANGQIVASGDGYDVQLSYTYAEEIKTSANAVFSVSVTDSGGAPAISASTAATFTVVDANLHAGTLIPPVATEGIAFSNVVVFHFTDDAGAYADIADYTAVVTLGDGNQVTLTSTPSANGQIVARGGGYDVQLSYTYAEEIKTAQDAVFSVSVTDSGGAPAISASTATPFTVADAALNYGAFLPPVAIEGQPFTNVTVFHFTDNAGIYADITDYTAVITLGDGHTVTVNSAGTVGTPPAGASGRIVASGSGYDVQLSYTYAEELDSLTHSFGVLVTDAGGATPLSISTGIYVADAALHAGALTPPTATEGIAFTNVPVFRFTDDAGAYADIADYTAVVTLGDGNLVTLTSTPSANGQIVASSGGYDVQLSYTYAEEILTAENAVFSVSVTDSGGAPAISASTVAPFTVADAALHLTLNAPSPTVSVPLTNIVVGTVTDDAGAFSLASDLSATIDWGDGNTTSGTIHPLGGGQYQVIGSHTYLSNTSGLTFKVTVNDDGGSTDNKSATINVAYTAPTIALSGNASVDEGSTYTLNMGAISWNDTITGYQINWGDNSPIDFFPAGGNPANTIATHVYADGPANPQISVGLIDSHGGHNSGTLNISVNNVAPTASLNNFGDVNEGTSAFVFFTNPFDPSAGDTAAGFHYAYDFNYNPNTPGTKIFNLGDGTYAGSSTTSSAAVPASFLMVPGVHAILARIIDRNGGFTDYTTTINVANVAPIVTLPSAATASVGSPFTLTSSFTDQGNDGPWTGQVDYGDGTGLQNISVNSNNQTFTLNHTYATAGNYTLTVYITDHPSSLDGVQPAAASLTGSATSSITASVTTLKVVSATPTPNGFDFTFNRAIQVGDLAMYGSGVTSPISVMLGSTVIHGSLVWDANTNTAHFVQTSGLLAAGTYTVTLRSGASGNTFHDTVTPAHGALDGNGDNTAGDDYVQNFVVAAPSTRILSLPNFARGPGQQVIVNQHGTQTGATGLPITINDGTNVQSVEFILNYNPNLLSISALASDITLPSANWAATINATVPGQLHVVVYSLTNATLGSGPRTVITFNNVVVPSNVQSYGAAELLSFSGVLLNESLTNPIACVGASAVHKAVNLGDVDSTSSSVFVGSVNSNDAYLISRVVAGLDSGFAADPLTDPVILGDLTGDGTLSGLDATDASQIQTRGAGSQPQVPAPVINATTLSGLDPTVQTGLGHTQTIFATPGSNVSATIQITDNANGMTSGDLVITYDPSLLTMATDLDGDALGVSLSSQLAGWALTTFVSAPGTIHVGFFSTGGAITGPAGLLSLLFTVPGTDAGGAVSPLNVAPAAGSGLNGGNLVMTPDNGSITIAAQAPIVTGVFASSTSWSPNFLNSLAGQGLGSSTLGYAMPTGVNQLRDLYWSNINQISIQFSEGVTITENALSIAGVNNASYAFSGFTYDSTTHVATWTLAAPLPADKLLLTLNSSVVTDGSGHQLDGEWTNGASTFSGNGTAGGNFNYRVNVLPGDVNGSGTVDLTDLTMLSGNWQTANTAVDINGDGSVDLTDLTILSGNWQVSLPASEPQAQSLVVAPAADPAPVIVAAAPAITTSSDPISVQLVVPTVSTTVTAIPSTVVAPSNQPLAVASVSNAKPTVKTATSKPAVVAAGHKGPSYVLSLGHTGAAWHSQWVSQEKISLEERKQS